MTRLDPDGVRPESSGGSIFDETGDELRNGLDAAGNPSTLENRSTNTYTGVEMERVARWRPFTPSPLRTSILPSRAGAPLSSTAHNEVISRKKGRRVLTSDSGRRTLKLSNLHPSTQTTAHPPNSQSEPNLASLNSSSASRLLARRAYRRSSHRRQIPLSRMMSQRVPKASDSLPPVTPSPLSATSSPLSPVPDSSPPSAASSALTPLPDDDPSPLSTISSPLSPAPNLDSFPLSTRSSPLAAGSGDDGESINSYRAWLPDYYRTFDTFPVPLSVTEADHHAVWRKPMFSREATFNHERLDGRTLFAHGTVQGDIIALIREMLELNGVEDVKVGNEAHWPRFGDAGRVDGAIWRWPPTDHGIESSLLVLEVKPLGPKDSFAAMSAEVKEQIRGRFVNSPELDRQAASPAPLIFIGVVGCFFKPYLWSRGLTTAAGVRAHQDLATGTVRPGDEDEVLDGSCSEFWCLGRRDGHLVFQYIMEDVARLARGLEVLHPAVYGDEGSQGSHWVGAALSPANSPVSSYRDPGPSVTFPIQSSAESGLRTRSQRASNSGR